MNRIVAALLALVCFCAPVSSATLLPPGVQQFLDANGKPLAGGSIQFLVPNTTAPKSTWADPAQTILNPNPVPLDSAGRAILYGTGAYRQIVRDAVGNLVYDQLTADTSSAQIAWGGTSAGTANAQTVSATNFTSADGQIVGFLAGLTNTGQLTVSANASGPIPVLTDSRAGPVNLTGQEVTQGSAVLLIYDAGRGAFHLVGGGLQAPGFGGSVGFTAANVVDLGQAAGHYARVSGSATITSFGSTASVASPVYLIAFESPVVLQRSAALILPGSQDNYLAGGDTATAVYLGSGSWQVISVSRNDVAGTAGAIQGFATAACPAGWVKGDGTAISRAAFPRLFAALGTFYGSGDGSSTFNIPDARGVFLRGVDGGRGYDPSRVLGSYQADQIQDHIHNSYVGSVNVAAGGNVITVFGSPGGSLQPTTTSSGAASGAETRPKNLAVTYCIKT